MYKAIEAAQKSNNEIPVGAIILKDNKIIATACNEKENTNDLTNHAEIVAIRQAEKILNNWRLHDCEMYVTLEPCPMCAWAIISSRIKSLYFGSYDRLYGALGSTLDLRNIANSKLKVYGGIMEDECNKLLNSYLKNMRNNDES